MGYYTRYSITSKPDMDEEELQKMVHDVINKDSDYEGYQPFDDECKWYDHDKHMKEVSKLHPEIVFHLTARARNPETSGTSITRTVKFKPARPKSFTMNSMNQN